MQRISRNVTTDSFLLHAIFHCDLKNSVLQAFPTQGDLIYKNLRTVSDIARDEVHTVLPETPVDEVIRMIDCNDIERIWVVG